MLSKETTSNTGSRSSFPGMDPFIEGCGIWEDFHSHIIELIGQDLADKAPPRYVVRTGERKERPFKPDVGVYGGSPGPNVAATAVLSDPTEAVTLRALISEEFRESFVEIHATEPERRLVTCIEVLSPANKRKGTAGWDQYLRKRQALLLGEANLVEIDLVRGGQRMPMVDPLPDSPYYLLVARKAFPEYGSVMRAHYRQRLPVIPVPLEAPDSDLPLDLQPMIDAIYARFHYERDLDYRKPITPPLPAEDQVWLNQQLVGRS